MTATPVFASGTCAATSRRARARGVDRLVMRVSMSVLLWARRRADRAALPREHALRMRELAISMEQREHEASLRAARVR